jgi:ribosomal protein L7/L12
MANPAKEVGEFNLIITEVDAGKAGDAAGAFSRAFSLDETLAGQILKSAPIIFATKLTKSEVKALTPKLTELSSQGMEFRITARVAGKVPKVNWPVRPQFTAAGSGGPNGLAFEWDNNAFVCPGCGETFLFRRLGKLKLSEGAVATASASPETRSVPAMAPAPKAAPATKAAPKPAPAPLPADDIGFADDAANDVALPEPAPEGELQGVEGVEPLPGEGESLDLPDSVEEIKLDEADLAPAVEAEPDAAPEPAAEPVEELSAAAEEHQEAAEAPAAAGPADGELYNVFLSKITDRSKQDKVAELISKVKGCSINEAKDLTSRLVIPIAKNISKAQAEDILGQFKKIKIFGRMTKVK